MATGIKIATATDEKLLRQIVLSNLLTLNKLSEDPTQNGDQLLMEPSELAAAAATEVK
jgi:hypothetical protein